MEHTGKGVEEILQQHWSIYGRNYFTRYDYEECALEPCNEMVALLEKTITDPSFVGKAYSSGGKTYKVKVADNFSYTDPVDKSVSTKQVRNFASQINTFRLILIDRIIFSDHRVCALCSMMAAVSLYVSVERVALVPPSGNSEMEKKQHRNARLTLHAISIHRLYIDSYEKDNVLGQASEMLEPLIQIALEISQLPKFTGRNAPTVIT